METIFPVHVVPKRPKDGQISQKKFFQFKIFTLYKLRNNFCEFSAIWKADS